MITIDKMTINDIPALIVAKTKDKQNPLPVVTYLHGFTSGKEQNLSLAYFLADKGYRVVLPDSMLHGEREKDIPAIRKQVSFWEIVMQSVHEVKVIKDYLEENNLLLDGRFGLAGTSMGGITTSAALTQYDWVKTAAILMGSPKITTYAKTLVESFKRMGSLPVTDEMIEQLYNQLETMDLSKQPEKLANRPVLFWHGDNDSVVPFDHSYTFYEDVKDTYTNTENIRFIKEKNRDHKVSRFAMLETTKWFAEHL